MTRETKPAPKPVKEKPIKPRRKKGANEKKLLEIEADRIIRRIVLARDKWCCCPSPKNGHSQVLQAGHLITRGSKSVRWDLWNVNVQCSSCNMLHEHRPERYINWFIQEFGLQAWLDLNKRGEVVAKISVQEMKWLCIGLNHMLVVLNRDIINRKNPLPLYRFTQEDAINLGKSLDTSA